MQIEKELYSTSANTGDLLISIVVVGYNAARHIGLCLDSIYKQTFRGFEVIFVDNGSSDETMSVLKSYPEVRVIKNDKNTGFCFANNQGISKARGRFMLLLNADIVLDRDFLREMKNVTEVNSAALFSAKILRIDGRTIDSTGLIISRFYRFFDRGSGEKDVGQYDKKPAIFGPCAAAALYKKDMLEDIKYNDEYFDKDFFFLGEDFDIAWRAIRKRWKAKFVPSAICYHARNSTNFNHSYRQYFSFRNRYFLLIKNADLDLRYIIVFLLYDIPRLVYMLFTNRYTLKALYEMLLCTPKMLKKRHNR